MSNHELATASNQAARRGDDTTAREHAMDPARTVSR